MGNPCVRGSRVPNCKSPISTRESLLLGHKEFKIFIRPLGKLKSCGEHVATLKPSVSHFQDFGQIALALEPGKTWFRSKTQNKNPVIKQQLTWLHHSHQESVNRMCPLLYMQSLAVAQALHFHSIKSSHEPKHMLEFSHISAMLRLD